MAKLTYKNHNQSSKKAMKKIYDWCRENNFCVKSGCKNETFKFHVCQECRAKASKKYKNNGRKRLTKSQLSAIAKERWRKIHESRLAEKAS